MNFNNNPTRIITQVNHYCCCDNINTVAVAASIHDDIQLQISDMNLEMERFLLNIVNQQTAAKHDQVQ